MELRRLGPYELLEKLGEGGMGAVYRARDTRLDRTVALKILESDDAEEIQRFQREARTSAKLRHPRIVAIHDVGQEGTTHYFTMDLIEGCTLDAEPMTGRRALEIVRDVARAVHHAHEQGIVHRDLKPGNIMISPDGVAMVMDFGLARNVASGSKLTLSGCVLGTPNYMSPEQARGELSRLDRRSDVYSLCAVLYERLVGVPPHKSDTIVESIHLAATTEVTPPSRRGVRIAGDIETILMKGLDFDRERRYPTAAALADDLDRYLNGEAIEARRPGLGLRLARFLRRHPLAAGAAGLILIGAAVGIYGVTLHRRESAIDKKLTSRREVQPHLDRVREMLERTHSFLRTPRIPKSTIQQYAADAWKEAERAVAVVPIMKKPKGFPERRGPFATGSCRSRRISTAPSAPSGNRWSSCPITLRR